MPGAAGLILASSGMRRHLSLVTCHASRLLKHHHMPPSVNPVSDQKIDHGEPGE